MGDRLGETADRRSPIGRFGSGSVGDQFRCDGVDEGTLRDFAANAAAQGFYSRLGWQPDGAERVEPHHGEPELRLRRTLRDGAGNGGAA